MQVTIHWRVVAILLLAFAGLAALSTWVSTSEPRWHYVNWSV